MAKLVSDCTDLMRIILGRRNENDPDSSDQLFRSYLSDFVNLTMSDDVKIFEQFGTLSFTIDNSVPTGIYTFNDVGATHNFTNISTEGFISLTVPVGESVSWNRISIWQDPGVFYDKWGINNYNILIPGYPTDMLYYGTEMVFRTVPDTTYDVEIYGYKIVPAFAADGDPEIPFDYWFRYLCYGAALNYARDYRFDPDTKAQLKADFSHERKQLLTRCHNQIKNSRSVPRF